MSELLFCNDTTEKIDELETTYNELFDKTLKVLGKEENYSFDVTLVDRKTIHELNKNYRGIDRETDVISFAFLDNVEDYSAIETPVGIPLGEIYICVDVARENAQKYGNLLNRELKFLFVHGLLHLFGYDHMKEEDEKVMFDLQDKILDM